jgi:hypothetical protein
MASAGLSYEDLQIRKKLLLDELQETTNTLNQQVTEAGSMDIHHPERSPGWKPYRHQAYPRMVYHPIKLDPQIEANRLSIRRRNDANPTYAPLDIPQPEPLKRKVHSKTEEDVAVAEGFVLIPPQLNVEESEPVPAKRDPLAESVPPAKRRA